MGKTSRDKGVKGEREFDVLAQENGCTVARHNKDPNLPDMTLDKLTCEVKYRKNVPKAVYDWLEQDGADVVAMRRISTGDRGKPWLVVMRAGLFFELMENRRNMHTN
jgi:Holliday junction resolvase